MVSHADIYSKIDYHTFFIIFAVFGKKKKNSNKRISGRTVEHFEITNLKHSGVVHMKQLNTFIVYIQLQYVIFLWYIIHCYEI